MSLPAVLAGVALLAANGFFVAAEFAILAARRSRMEQLAAEGNKAAASAVAGLRELSLVLAGTQLGITMASFGLGAVAEPAVEDGLEALLAGVAVPPSVRHAIAFAVALAVVVFLHMVVGEMAPKSWAISDPEGAALLLARPLRGFVVALGPFIRLLNAAANRVVRLVGVEPQDERVMVHNPADLMLLLHESVQHGQLRSDQHRLLARAMELPDLDAEAAMMPRRDIVAVPAEATVDELEAVASRTGRSRLPVYDGELDRIRGILHVKDLLALDGDERRRATAGTLARPALVTPESRPIEDLMLDMRQQRQHVAVVVDEFGSVTGLVALEDLIEEIIGDFEDESDRLGAAFRRRRDGSVVVSGALRPDKLRALVGVELPEGDWETVAGYLIAALGRLPRVGDRVTVGGVSLEVAAMDDHRVVDVLIRPAGAPP